MLGMLVNSWSKLEREAYSSSVLASNPTGRSFGEEDTEASINAWMAEDRLLQIEGKTKIIKRENKPAANNNKQVAWKKANSVNRGQTHQLSNKINH